MADKKTPAKGKGGTKNAAAAEAPAKKMTRREREERQIKDAATRVANLSPLAKAELLKEMAAQQTKSRISGFNEFLREQSVIGIGIGLVLGTQVKTVVDQIMLNFVNPLTGLLPGQQRLSSKSFTFHLGERAATVNWGAIVYALFTFIMVMIIVYAIFKFLKLDKLTKKKD
jgi:large-conductance mechanosensitive channel